MARHHSISAERVFRAGHSRWTHTSRMCYGISARQLSIFVVGWIGYSATYIMRKPLGVVKGDMQSELRLSSTDLGWMDMALVLPYALFQMVCGSLGDRLGAGFTFGICLILTGFVMCSFGSWSNLYVFLILLFLNGLFLSLCWPNATKVVGSYFPSGSHRGTVFGIFGTSAFAGGFLGTAFVVYLQTRYDWRSAFFLPSAVVVCIGVLVLLTFKEAKISNAPVQSGDEPVSVEKDDNKAVTKPGTLRWSSLWAISTVPELAIAALCIKIVRYASYGWIPLYLFQHLKYSKGQAGMFSTMFDVGGVFGSALIGVFINRFFQGRALRGCMVGIFISTVSLALFMFTASWGFTINSAFLFMAGAFNCGPDIILVSLVPADIGSRDGRNAAAAITGLVNGFGSLGSVIQGPLVGYMLGASGWSAVLLFMVVTSAVGTLVTLRAAMLDTSRTSTSERTVDV